MKAKILGDMFCALKWKHSSIQKELCPHNFKAFLGAKLVAVVAREEEEKLFMKDKASKMEPVNIVNYGDMTMVFSYVQGVMRKPEQL